MPLPTFNTVERTVKLRLRRLSTLAYQSAPKWGAFSDYSNEYTPLLTMIYSKAISYLISKTPILHDCIRQHCFYRLLFRKIVRQRHLTFVVCFKLCHLAVVSPGNECKRWRVRFYESLNQATNLVLRSQYVRNLAISKADYRFEEIILSFLQLSCQCRCSSYYHRSENTAK